MSAQAPVLFDPFYRLWGLDGRPMSEEEGFGRYMARGALAEYDRALGRDRESPALQALRRKYGSHPRMAS